MCEPISIGLIIAGTAASFAGQMQQASFARRQQKITQRRFQYEQAILRNQQIAARQEITHERRQERIRQLLLSQEGGRDFGELQVAFAANGQLVDAGSAADTTQELAGEVAFKKLLSQHASDLRERNLNLDITNLETDVGLVKFGAAESKLAAKAGQAASKINLATTVLSGGRELNKLRFR